MRSVHSDVTPLSPLVAYTVRNWTSDEFSARVDELLTVYVAAMRYPDPSLEYRRPMWLEHARRAGFRCVVAVDPNDQIVGLSYGYTGGYKQWWNTEVRRGMSDDLATRWMANYRELTELHVRPDRQGAGIGEVLLRAFLDGAPERTVLLSTPEGENRAWRLYRRLGFVDVLRHYRFTGDPRPFAILGRTLPI
jgi:ribosomal protein S18 acetylase RimI-like enzyme